jgi:penicillin-binding protein 2
VRGTAGASRVEVNAYGRVIRELGRDPGVPGSDIYLTIDNEVQKFVAQRLGNESAACVVMDVATGDVIAMASTPGYDPNEFNVGITPAQWKGLMTDDTRSADQQGFVGCLSAGLDVQAGVALSALDSGLLPADFSVNCTGSRLRQLCLPLLEERRTWACRLAPRYRGLLRRLLL